MVDKNRLKAIWKSFSMASPNSSHARGFCLGDHPSRTSLGLPIPIGRLWSPTGQKGPLGLFLQLDGIPHRRCPPAGSTFAATTGTDSPATAALGGRVIDGGAEHGPLGLNVPHLPLNVLEALPEVGVKAPPNRVLRPSECVWASRVSPASCPTIGANSPPGRGQWKAPPPSLPECPKHAAADQAIVKSLVDHDAQRLDHLKGAKNTITTTGITMEPLTSEVVEGLYLPVKKQAKRVLHKEVFTLAALGVHRHRPVSPDPDAPRARDARRSSGHRSSGGGRRSSGGRGRGAPPAPVRLGQRPAALVAHGPRLLLVDGLAVKLENLLQGEVLRSAGVPRWIHPPIRRLVAGVFPGSLSRSSAVSGGAPRGHPLILPAPEAR
ncbi:unnamed protein product [Menidia menidia]|uniref:(Atlantic silverside) hypothetical protein n=1 Tax=Menidia menidia TaxID=238744 RepID=A0A8S4BWN0_9TELE|nr:unnamed protein product [Menidia menidia]